MRRCIFIVFFIIGLISVEILHAKLIDLYKKGVLPLTLDSSFGKTTQWEELFYDEKQGFNIAPDGSFFVNNAHRHSISKFSPEGKYLFTFSQKGEGAGDVYFPGPPLILDNRYLVVPEYQERMRISIFDFSGKFVKIVRTKHPPFNILPLRNNILVYTHNQPIPTPGPKLNKTEIYALDVISGKETLLMTVETPRDYVSAGKGFIISMDNLGALYMARTIHGNLLVGLSHRPVINMFSPEGKFIRSFNININHLKVTDEFREKARARRLASLDEIRNLTPEMKRKFRNNPDPPMGEYLPYYKSMTVDEEGNILLLKWTDCVDDQCPLIFSVYTSIGAYVCDFKIEKGIYDFSFDTNNKNILFTEKGIFGLFRIRDSEDITLKITKILIK